MQNQQQYNSELNERYLKFINRAVSATDASMDMVNEQRRREKKRKSKQKQRADTVDLTGSNGENASLVMNRVLETKYIIKTLIIDSSHRNTTQFPNANDFVVRLEEPLKNVGAIRLMKTEYFEPCATAAYMVLNGMKVPMQTYNLDSAYLYLNGFINTLIANDANTNMFGRIGPGLEMYPAVTGDVMQDPYVYILRPAEPRLRKFHIRLMTHEGQLQPVTNARVILTISCYCIA